MMFFFLDPDCSIGSVDGGDSVLFLLLDDCTACAFDHGQELGGQSLLQLAVRSLLAGIDDPGQSLARALTLGQRNRNLQALTSLLLALHLDQRSRTRDGIVNQRKRVRVGQRRNDRQSLGGESLRLRLLSVLHQQVGQEFQCWVCFGWKRRGRVDGTGRGVVNCCKSWRRRCRDAGRR